jgi:glutathione synthase/RimK-type ligase-like ATP-grasp enzyme
VVNRSSPSAHCRGNGQAIFHTLQWLRHLERRGTPVVNGSAAYEVEISKALQLDLLAELGLPYPRAVVINHPVRAVEAASRLRYPVLVKANVGGSGAGITRYDGEGELRRAVAGGDVSLGVDGVALVQELAPLRDGRITRVETLGGRFLYAIHVYPDGDSFNLCPADICRTADGEALERTFCAADAAQNGLRVEAASLPADVVAQVERIAIRAGLDVGGIEYLIDDRDGRAYFYDINALSNFVADAPRVIGFDPFARLVDYLEERLRRPRARVA